VGKLVLATELDNPFQRVISSVQEQTAPFFEVEQNIIGITHAEVEAYLLGIWGLPNPIVEAIAFHHRPQDFSRGEFNAVAAVHAANALEYEMSVGIPSNTSNNRLNPEYLDLLGLNERLPVWREVCGRIQHVEQTDD